MIEIETTNTANAEAVQAEKINSIPANYMAGVQFAKEWEAATANVLKGLCAAGKKKSSQQHRDAASVRFSKL